MCHASSSQTSSRVMARRRLQIMPGVEHRQHKGLNNRAENSHQPTRVREKVMRRFKSAGHAQRFLSAFGIITSHFRPRRHLLTADTNSRAVPGRAAVEIRDVGRGELRPDSSLKIEIAGHHGELNSASSGLVWSRLYLYQLKLTVPLSMQELKQASRQESFAASRCSKN